MAARGARAARVLTAAWGALLAVVFITVSLAWLRLWRLTLLLEAVFHVYLAARVAMLQRSKAHVPAKLRARMTREERAASLARVLSSIASASTCRETGIERFLSLWFKGAVPFSQLRRGDVRRFLAAHFLFSELSDLTPSQRSECEEMLLAVEAAKGRAFTEGDAGAAVMRVSMPSEELRWVHFPLGVYAALAAVHCAAHVTLRCCGFGHFSAGVLSYYHRPASDGMNAKATPVVLLPGIGIGVAAYVPLVLNILCTNGAEVFVVELPHVAAGRLHGCVPEEDDVVASLLCMLAAHAPHSGAAAAPAAASPRARFVAHSYGTFVLAWLLRHPAAASTVDSLLLIDPVAVLIAFPHVLHGAVYRAPLQPPLAALFADAAGVAVVASAAGTAGAATGAAGGAGALRRVLARLRRNARLTCSYCFTKEAHIALSVQRHTFWPSASLWLDDIPSGCRVMVALSEGDNLLPVREVAAYAAAVAARRHGEIELSVVHMRSHEHGEVALNPQYWPRLSKALADSPCTTMLASGNGLLLPKGT